MKQGILVILVLILLGCQSNASKYSKSEQEQLKKMNILDEAEQNCSNPESVKVMLQSDFKKENLKKYCALQFKEDLSINIWLDSDLSMKEIQSYLNLENARVENIERYKAFPSKDLKTKVLSVNMNLDMEPYAFVDETESEAIDLLIDKFHAVTQSYRPSDLVNVTSVCTQGVDFSCATITQQLRKETAEAFESFVNAGKKEGLNIVAIASYRSVEYQRQLYDYNISTSGQEYADQFYARPGHSEHHTGLAVDITFNNHNFTEIDQYEGYQWIQDRMHEYGFILRYPKNKEDITRYGYESWHLRYVGKELATYLYKNKITLDEYYGLKGN